MLAQWLGAQRGMPTPHDHGFGCSSSPTSWLAALQPWASSKGIGDAFASLVSSHFSASPPPSYTTAPDSTPDRQASLLSTLPIVGSARAADAPAYAGLPLGSRSALQGCYHLASSNYRAETKFVVHACPNLLCPPDKFGLALFPKLGAGWAQPLEFGAK